MGLKNALLIANVAHARQRPAKNAFRYHVYYLCTALSELPLLNRLALFSLNKLNVFSFDEKEYEGDPTRWMRETLAKWNVTQADGEIILLTMPRVLGYAFNPVSFWFCLDRAGQPRAVLADVRNTFGERHRYMLFHDDQRPITQDDWFSSEKMFHVSPFIPVTGFYRFRFAYGEEAVGVWIDHHDENGLLLTTSLTGKRSELSSRALAYVFFRYPLVTMKVISLIHYHALKLFLKGVKYRRKPAPPTTEISR